MKVPRDYSVYEMGMGERIGVFIVTLLACGALGILFYGTAITVVLTPIASYFSFKMYRDFIKEKRKHDLLISFRDFISRISSSFAGGRQMTEAMEEAAEDLYRGEDNKGIMAAEAYNILSQIKSGHMTDIEALSDFARRADMEDIYNFVRIYRSCRTKGGDMTATISKSVLMINDKIRIEHDIRSMMAQKRAEGLMITCMPVTVILLMRMTSPSYMEVMYGTLQGRFIMTGVLLGIAFAYYLIKKIMEIVI